MEKPSEKRALHDSELDRSLLGIPTLRWGPFLVDQRTAITPFRIYAVTENTTLRNTCQQQSLKPFYADT